LSQSNKSLAKKKSEFQVITVYELHTSKLITLKYMHVLRESMSLYTSLDLYHSTNKVAIS